MTIGAMLAFFSASEAIRAQETPTATPEATASPSPTAPPARSVRLSFLPPPIEGTISLGIYKNGQLVRVLHREADLDEFNIGADALSTKWDGKDDKGNDLPPGKYSAHGFLVSEMKIDEVPVKAVFPSSASPIRVKLVANPLDNNERPTIELDVGFDDEDVFLKTNDGLPLTTIAPRDETKRAAIVQENKNVSGFVDDGTALHVFQISGLAKMMAFDCGEFQLK